MGTQAIPSIILGVLSMLVGTPPEGDEQKKRKALLAFVLLLTLFLTVGWTILHVALGAYRVAFNLVLYFGFNAVALIGLLRATRFFGVWMWLHVLSFFVLPWTATWMEGGYEMAGFICVWSGMPVLELSAYRGWLKAGLLLLAHAAVAIFVAWAQHAGWIVRSVFNVLDLFGNHAPPTEGARLIFYIINVAGTAMVAMMFATLASAKDAPPR